MLSRGARAGSNAGSLVGAALGRTWRVREQGSGTGFGNRAAAVGPERDRDRDRDREHGSQGAARALRSAARAQPLYGQRISSRALRTPLADAKPHFSLTCLTLLFILRDFRGRFDLLPGKLSRPKPHFSISLPRDLNVKRASIFDLFLDPWTFLVL